MSTARRHRLTLGVLVAGFAALAFWTCAGVRPWGADRLNVWHHYEYLAEGFLKGQLSLSLEPSRELLALPDPYDPARNAPYRLWDASLYRGRYYLYYGPAPALAMAAARLVLGHVPGQELATAAFAAAALAALGLLMREIALHHFARLSPAGFGFAFAVAAHASWLPVVLRRPGVWELPIVASLAFLWWALYFLWRLHRSGRMAWAVAAGGCLALLVGSRVTFVFAALVAAAGCLSPTLGGLARPRSWRRSGVVCAGILGLGGLGLLAYNMARFGRPLEFGQSYQLWGMDERHVAHMSLSYLAFNADTYFLALPSFGAYFPFLHPEWAGAFPQGYIAYEEMYGIPFMVPAQLLGSVGLLRALRCRSGDPMRATVVAAAWASAFSAAILLCWAGACSRYIAELLAGWTVVSAVGLMAALDSGRLLRTAALAAGLWTIACVCLASAEFRGFMRLTHPGTYAALARVLDRPALAVAGHGDTFGPLALRVQVPATFTSGETVLVASGRPQRANQLVMTAAGGARVRLSLLENQHVVLETPPMVPDAGVLAFTLRAPWLYPPRESAYWEGRPAELKETFSITWAGGGVETRSPLWNDPVAFRPALRSAAPGEPGVLSAQTLPTP